MSCMAPACVLGLARPHHGAHSLDTPGLNLPGSTAYCRFHDGRRSLTHKRQKASNGKQSEGNNTPLFGIFIADGSGRPGHARPSASLTPTPLLSSPLFFMTRPLTISLSISQLHSTMCEASPSAMVWRRKPNRSYDAARSIKLMWVRATEEVLGVRKDRDGARGETDRRGENNLNDTIPGPELSMVMGKATRQENNSLQLFLDDEAIP